MLTEAIGWPLAPGSGVAILFDCALKGAFLLLVVGALLRVVLRRAPAAARYALCVAATGGLLALPAVSALAPRWSLPLPERWARQATEAPAIAPEEVSASRLSPQSAPLPLESAEWLPPFEDEWRNNPFLTRGSGEKMESQTGTASPASDGIKGDDRTDASAVSDETVAAAARVDKPPLAPSRAGRFSFRWPSAPVMLTGAWASVAALAFLPWVVGLCALRRLLRRSRRIERGGAVEQLETLCRSLALPTPPLYETDRSLVPMAGSFFGSFILLPPDAAAWSEAKLRNVLTHEMGHIARRDDLAYLAARLAAALHWFNPFVWALLRVLRYERERACDDLVLRQGAVSCDYASHLVEILKNASSVHPAMLAATPMACPRRLEKRIVAILDDHLNRKGLTMRNRITTLAVVTALTLSLGGATVTRSVETNKVEAKAIEQTSTEEATRTKPPTQPDKAPGAEKTPAETAAQVATADPAQPEKPAAPQEYTLPEGHVSAFGKDYQYAFLSGDGAGYKPPDYEGFFPDDEEAGKKLDEMFEGDVRGKKIKWMDPDEVWRTVRQGWKRSSASTKVKVRSQSRWQNPDSIEILYHLSAVIRLNMGSERIYPQLSPKIPSAILKSFVDLSMKMEGEAGRNPFFVSMMVHGQKQSDEILKYIEPYLKSSDPSVVKKASELRGMFDKKSTQEFLEVMLKDMEKKRQAFLNGTDEERRRIINAPRYLSSGDPFPPKQREKEDAGYLDIFSRYKQDPDLIIRRNIAAIICASYLENMSADENPRAIQIVLEMLPDLDADIRSSRVIPVLSSVRNKSDQVVRVLLDIAYVDRYSIYHEIVDGLREDRVVARKLLEADLADFQNDPQKALNAFEVYGDVLGEPPASTPDWVAGMTALSGMKEVVFYLKATDPKTQTDLEAFRATVRETLLQNKERGGRWLKQFYLDRRNKTWIAVLFTPVQDRYLFQNQIRSSGKLVSEDGFARTYMTSEEKTRFLFDENLRTPDMQPVKYWEITFSNEGETAPPLPAEAVAVWEKKKKEAEVETQRREEVERKFWEKAKTLPGWGQPGWGI